MQCSQETSRCPVGQRLWRLSKKYVFKDTYTIEYVGAVSDRPLDLFQILDIFVITGKSIGFDAHKFDIFRAIGDRPYNTTVRVTVL